MGDQDDLDFNFIENSLQMLGVKMRRCEICNKKIVTQVTKIDRICEDCFEAQLKLTKTFKPE